MKRIHPEWEKFAKAVEGVVRVGAINVDEHQQVGQQFSIRGFPTVKFWGLGEKVMNKAEDYNGQRDAGSIQARAISVITSSSVKELSTSKELRDAAESAPGKKIVVLFSAKSRVPPIYAVLSHSPRLKVMPFYFVGKQVDSDLAKEFGVEKLPGIVVLNATGADMKMVKYPGKKIAYNPIAKYLLACAVDTFDEATFSEEGGEAEEGPESSASSAKKNAKIALPTKAIAATTEALENFCSPKTRKVAQQTPLCVVSFTSAFSLDDVRKSFGNEPLVFLEAHDDHDVVLNALNGNIGLPGVALSLKNKGARNVLLLRASKQDTVRFKTVEGVKSSEDLISFLQMVLNGQFPLSKGDAA